MYHDAATIVSKIILLKLPYTNTNRKKCIFCIWILFVLLRFRFYYQIYKRISWIRKQQTLLGAPILESRWFSQQYLFSIIEIYACYFSVDFIPTLEKKDYVALRSSKSVGIRKGRNVLHKSKMYLSSTVDAFFEWKFDFFKKSFIKV